MKKQAQKIGRFNRLFLFALPLAVLAALGILFFSSKKFLADSSCGCGMSSVNSTGKFDYLDIKAVFNNQPVNIKMAELTPLPESLAQSEGAVLGATTGERWIEIDLSEQRLYAHEGNQIAFEFPVSSGKWALTPTGEFRIWIKLRYTKMAGGSKELHTYYYLPNVPYTQYFYKDFGLHGTYWHNNFGQPMSHGCVNLSVLDAEKLFYWTSPVIEKGKNMAYPTKNEPGTRVVIHG